MSKFLTTVEGYEDQVVEFVTKAQGPVVDYVAKGVELVQDRVPVVPEYAAKGVELVESRLPSVSYPSALPTPKELIDSQVAFAKKLVDASSDLVTAVFETVAPVVGFPKPKPAVKAVKATKATKAA
jgi:hypothetical protein